MHLIELVPREISVLDTEVSACLSLYPRLSGVNIPDVLRLENRSWDMAKRYLKKGVFVVPHIRTIDLSQDQHMTLFTDLVESGLKQVLLVTGDPPSDGRRVYGVTPVMVAQMLKERFPDLNVYGALDPYRQSMDDELAYLSEKTVAGMDGFFTQPFFDVTMAEAYLKAIEGQSVFLGVSPVCDARSRGYWETRNNVVFPDGFRLDLDYQFQLARDLMALAERYGQNTYLMPIKMDPLDYLKGVFTPQ